ncbi:sensor histidine kinase [Enterococcus florum]|uniref:Sensor histidine kinase n=1 Tax=Enterococcus florum TaxID=2480627 RepID=A0A4V0WPI7_9ENTE|nr:sensor histidine kinase [Enterococcus florum]
MFHLVNHFVSIKQNQFLRFVAFSSIFIIGFLPVYPNDSVNIIGPFLFFLIASLWSLEGPMIHKISLVFILHPLLAALNFLIEDIGLRLWIAGGQTAWMDLSVHVVTYGIRCGIWFAIYRMFCSSIPYRKTQLSLKLWLLIDCICLTPLFTMISLILLTPSDTLFIYPASFACVLTSLSTMYMTGYIAKSFNYELENQNLRLQKEYYLELENNQRQLRKLHHDMNNHFSVLLNLINEKEEKKMTDYLVKLTEQHQMTQKQFCKNSIVNAVLNAKYQLIAAENINSSIEVEIDHMVAIDDISLCSLFGNTIDNAIEAIRQSSQKKIELKARYYNGTFSYKISNTKDQPVLQKKQRFISTKQSSKDHGIGLETVRQIVESYGGTLQIDYDRDHFSLVVFISNV